MSLVFLRLCLATLEFKTKRSILSHIYYMLDKTMKGVLAGTFIISLAQTIGGGGGIFSFLTPFNMIITSLFVYSMGWVIAGLFYNKNGQDYSQARHVAMASIFAVPVVAVIFVPTFLYPYIVGKAFVFRFLMIVAFFSYVYLLLTNISYKPRLTPFVVGFGAFVFVMALATIFSMDPSRSFWSNYERMEGYINLLCLFVLGLVATSLCLKDTEWTGSF
jgi:hypothetical protein